MNDDFFYEEVKKICKGYDTEFLCSTLKYNIKSDNRHRYEFFRHMVSIANKKCDVKTLLNGYAVEIVHSSFLVSDDIMDNSSIRRDKKCYYLVRGMKAYKDSLFYFTLGRRIIDSKCYKKFNETIFFTALGQMIDSSDKRLEDFTMQNYRDICYLKTSFYSFYFPMYVAFTVSGLDIPKFAAEFCDICGLVLQMNDDLLNYNPELSKKTSNDLEEKKLTFVTALLSEHSNEQFAKEFINNGKITPELIKFVERRRETCRMEVKKYLKYLTEICEKDYSKYFMIYCDVLESKRVK